MVGDLVADMAACAAPEPSVPTTMRGSAMPLRVQTWRATAGSSPVMIFTAYSGGRAAW